MRLLSRAALLGLLAFSAGGTAMPSPASAAGTLGVTLSPDKGGSLTVGAPTTFTLTATTPSVLYDLSGNTRLKAIKANLPEQLLFNTTDFPQCNVAKFLADKVCPKSTQLGTVEMKVDAGPDFPTLVDATAELFFGSGFTMLAFVHATSPAPIDQPVVGELRSSGTTGYGLQIYIPVPEQLSVPIDKVYPVVKSMKAVVTPPTRRVKVPGSTKKVKLPLAGLGSCKGALNFSLTIVYSDASGVTEKATDPTATKVKCKK